jgi:hypothetical protein
MTEVRRQRTESRWRGVEGAIQIVDKGAIQWLSDDGLKDENNTE